jgi:hypothetical protein
MILITIYLSIITYFNSFFKNNLFNHNNIDKLIAVADLLLVGVLAAVSWSAARRALKEGKRPWIESGTTIGLFGVGGAAVWQLFQRVGHGYDTAN